MKIFDATGKGYGVKVDAANKLKVHAVTETELVHEIENGVAYNFNTGLISITGDATLMYLKNNATNDFFLEDLAIGSFDGITHSNDPYITVIRNPTGGDLITDATAISINQNRNFGSTLTATVDVYKGKVGGTITGGNDIGIFQCTGGSRAFFDVNFLLPKGSSVAVKLTANASSGTANWYCAMIGYFKDAEAT